MLKFILAIGILVIAIPSSAQFHISQFNSLHKLEGTWKMKAKKGFLFEQWSKSNDSTLVSRSFRVNGTDTTFEETVELAFRTGRITYTPTLYKQNEGKPVTFVLSGISTDKYVFENMTHDFPQKIMYQPGSKKLSVTISGNIAGTNRQVPFSFERL